MRVIYATSNLDNQPVIDKQVVPAGGTIVFEAKDKPIYSAAAIVEGEKNYVRLPEGDDEVPHLEVL